MKRKKCQKDFNKLEYAWERRSYEGAQEEEEKMKEKKN